MVQGTAMGSGVPARATARTDGVHTATVLAALTRGLVDAAVTLGFVEGELLSRAGLDARELADPDARVPIALHQAPFSALVDDVRRARALALLADPALSGSEVGLLLGYAETAAFFRAFRRWTGTTPGRFRAGTRAP
jgi:AraC-like DNA-binding protein